MTKRFWETLGIEKPQMVKRIQLKKSKAKIYISMKTLYYSQKSQEI